MIICLHVWVVAHDLCKLHSIFPILPATSIWVSQLHCNTKKIKKLIINSSTDMRSDLVLFNYFLTLQQIPIASVIFLLLQQTHPIASLIFLLEKIDPIVYLLILLFIYSLSDLIAFLSFLLAIDPITSLFTSLTHSRSDCLIPTRWLEGSRLPGNQTLFPLATQSFCYKKATFSQKILRTKFYFFRHFFYTRGFFSC
jgi:hypothetical protein